MKAAASASSGALLGVYRPAAPLFVTGRGARLIADDGREFLDLTSGIAVNAFGYGDAIVTRVIEEAAHRGLIHTSNLFRTAPAQELAAELVARTFADRVFFCNSGAEANEAAFKFARRWATALYGSGKHEIVALRGSFHGRLFGSLAATDRAAYREPFEPLMPGVRFIDPLEPTSWQDAITEHTAAIIAEPVQGEGGVRLLEPVTLHALRAAADGANALLVLDEVQCGLGRTGSFLAHEHAGIVPDMVTLAKPLAAGLPMGAVLLTEQVAATLRPGDHATTFGGGPLVASVALSTVRRIGDPALLARVTALGSRLGDWLAELPAPQVRDVRGLGLIWGVETAEPAAAIIARAFEAGVLLVAAGEHVVRLLPPLNIDEHELAHGVAVLREALS